MRNLFQKIKTNCVINPSEPRNRNDKVLTKLVMIPFEKSILKVQSKNEIAEERLRGELNYGDAIVGGTINFNSLSNVGDSI